MNYKIVIGYKDEVGNINEESVTFTALSDHDAELIRHFNQEVAERKYGKANVISVTLHKV